MWFEFLTLIATFLLLFYCWHRHNYSYWQRQNVRHIKITPILGNFKAVFTRKQNIFENLYTLYNDAATKDEPIVGLYLLHRPVLLLKDLNLIKRIMIKDFSYFADRVIAADPVNDALTAHNLFFISSSKWKHLRTRISPLFTSGKLRQMYQIMIEIAAELEQQLALLPDCSEFDINELFVRFTTDMIASTGFGIQLNSLQSIDNAFFQNNKKIFELSLKRGLEFACFFLAPALVPLLGVKFLPTDCAAFFRKTLAAVVAERQASGVYRNDVVDKLIAMQQEAQLDANDPANDFDYLLAQAVVFLLAGFETSSSTTCFALYEIAKHPNVQQRLRQEILEAFATEGNTKALSYEKIQPMRYLSQVVDETLRLYPIAGMLERQLTRSLKEQSYSLLPAADFNIPHGLPVYVTPLGIHRDEKYWTNPNEFMPERFAVENRANINMDAYMPFGIGPRNCVGMRLGLLETKLGLIHFLKNYSVSVGEKTPMNVQFDPNGNVLHLLGGYYLKVQRISSM